MEADKDKLLNNKVFCILPWVHAYVEPTGNVLPCCSTDGRLPFGSVKGNSLKEIVTGAEQFKTMRLNMLAGKQSPSCVYCYKQEETSPWSFRGYANENFGHHLDEALANTNDDGSLNDFKMYYYDIRFSNICNFKCRTCGSDFSSSWAQENMKYGGEHANRKLIIKHADDNKGNLLKEVYEHINNIELAYFAGGEPLITEEHYLILEELIKHKRTDITLRYNTNMSNLKFKDYDLISLWKQFKKVEISASIDHYGKRAEYIRHGTDWGEVETNLNLIRNLEFIDYQFNTVLSVFNYLTLAEFYSYMKSNGLYRQKDHISLFRSMDPAWCCAQVLPRELKKIGTNKMNLMIKSLELEKFYSVQNLISAVAFTESEDTWEEQKKKFIHEITVKDELRGEDFIKTFPELASMMRNK